MLRIYRSPVGLTYQYEEGTQPDGYVLADRQQAEPARPEAASKSRKAANKQIRSSNK